MGRERGFTLTEILIAVSIIAVIAAIAIPNMLAAKLSANEASAIATLRTLLSSQAQLQGSGKIDVDNDAVGEYGTFAELTGGTGVRRTYVFPSGGAPAGATFVNQGAALDPPLLPEDLVESLNNQGELIKTGYGFMIFLPDAGDPARWVHEEVRTVTRGRGKSRTRVETMILRNDTGGPNTIGLDLSENCWCAYARPVKRGNSGVRVFFTSQAGDILQSPNESNRQEARNSPINGNAAYLGTGITSRTAVGTAGRDGNVWKIVN